MIPDDVVHDYRKIRFKEFYGILSIIAVVCAVANFYALFS